MNENIATKINLDIGVIKTLDVKNFKNVLVLTGAHYSLNLFNDIIAPLIKTKFHLYSRITSSPTDLEVYNISSFARTKDIDCIISIGGGAVMDCGRLVSLLLSHGGLLHEYTIGGTIGPLGITPNVIHHITVPTICGSGSEISGSAAFVMYRETKRIVSPYLVPNATYLDPEIMRGISEKTWAGISFNTFATALAAYVSTYANPTSDAFALEALKGYIEYSPKLLKDTNNPEYIKQMEVASINAFMAANFSSMGAIHAIADVLASRYGIKYGIALAIVCGEVSAASYKENKARYDMVIKMLSKTDKNIKVVIDKLIKKIGLVLPQLKDRIINEDMEKLVRECANNNMRGNPKLFTRDEIAEILRRIS